MVLIARNCLRSLTRVYLLLNFQSCLHMGHCCWGWECSHFTMQWMWKQWEQVPHTKGQSSPGSLQSGQQLSKGMRQMPQLSSLATHRQVATPVQLLMVTFISRILHTVANLN
ncbi:unnamed protein product [Spodoptera littoralis]|uniref:Uncharacterized protein n=1 Tax=Spodoptera littoralis TaxID=7109 RepID=A0A9P0IIX6_SPOLI|nr:unnamed protein product [Spodoptera littoralis]CAH1646792.1 unnamed protein product [Spodoptera littoralis]